MKCPNCNEELNFYKLHECPEETTVNKSNFSAGLALSLENIMYSIDSIVDQISKDEDKIVVPVVRAASALIKEAFNREANRLRQKG